MSETTSPNNDQTVGRQSEPATPDPVQEGAAAHEDFFDDDLPSAEALLDQLHAIDLQQLDVEHVATEMLGKLKWLHVIVMPAGAIMLALFSITALFLTHSPVWGFLIAAAVLFLLGKLLDRYERDLKIQAVRRIEETIADIEGEEGFLIYFRDFLPRKFQPLLQTLHRGQFHFIRQYAEAIRLLQEQLDPIKFQTWWLIKRDELRTIGKPIQYYLRRAERLKLLSDADLRLLLENCREKDILNMLLLTHDEQLARRALNLLSVLIARKIKDELFSVNRLNELRAKTSLQRILDTGRKLAEEGILSVQPDFFE